MANTEAPRPKRAREGSSWIPAGVALLSVALFMGWLATRQPEEPVAVAEPTDTVPATDEAAGVQVIEAAALGQHATTAPYVGQDVHIESVQVSSHLGPQLFWLELPGGSPYLVKLDPAAGLQAPATGSRIDLVGRIVEKNDATLNEWMESGVLLNDGHRMQAEFGTTYIEARRIQPASN